MQCEFEYMQKGTNSFLYSDTMQWIQVQYCCNFTIRFHYAHSVERKKLKKLYILSHSVHLMDVCSVVWHFVLQTLHTTAEWIKWLILMWTASALHAVYTAR